MDFMLILNMLKYGIIILLLLGLTASLLSPFVVLGEESMIADGLSHVSFMALAVGVIFFNEPFYVAIPIVILASILIKYLVISKKIKSDAALGIISSVSFAIGLILISFVKTTLNLETLINGSLWLRNLSDVIIVGILFILTTIFILTQYRKLISLTLDYEYAKVSKIKVNLLSYVFSSLVALFVVVGIKSVGVLLISSFLIFPLVTARVFAKNFKETFVYGMIFTSIIILFGILIAHMLNIATSSTIVVLYGAFYLILLGIEWLKVRVKQ